MSETFKFKMNMQIPFMLLSHVYKTKRSSTTTTSFESISHNIYTQVHTIQQTGRRLIASIWFIIKLHKQKQKHANRTLYNWPQSRPPCIAYTHSIFSLIFFFKFYFFRAFFVNISVQIVRCNYELSPSHDEIVCQTIV